MRYLVGSYRFLMVFIVVACMSRVGCGAAVGENRDAASGQGSRPTEALERLSRGAVQTSQRILWGVGKFLLSTGESVNYVWDVALNSVLELLKTGGAAYEAMVTRVVRVPVLGFGASGVNEALKTSLAAAESTAKFDSQNRKNAFATLNQKLAETGVRLSSDGDASLRGRPDGNGPVVFPVN